MSLLLLLLHPIPPNPTCSLLTHFLLLIVTIGATSLPGPVQSHTTVHYDPEACVMLNPGVPQGLVRLPFSEPFLVP